MGVVLIFPALVMAAMLYWGIYLCLQWNPDDRIVGICTSAWAVLGIFLYITQLLPVREPNPYQVVLITLLSASGYVVGRTVAALTKPEWTPYL